MGFLREIDLFDKFINTDYAKSTFGGKLFSALFAIFGLFFVCVELFTYSQPLVFRDLLYSPHREINNKVNITMKIHVHQPCYYLHLDNLDGLGTQTLNEMSYTVFKRLSKEGNFIGNLKESVQSVCPPCKGLIPGKKCCFCEDIINYLNDKPDEDKKIISEFPQCVGKLKLDVDDNETCLIETSIPIFKSKGEIHIGTGRNSKRERGKHNHDLGSFSRIDDLGHTIEEFYIDKPNNKTATQLKGKSYSSSRPAVFTYNIKVNTVKHTYNGRETGTTYEYSLNEGHIHYHGPALSDNPAIYFNYQFSPFTVVERTVTKNPLKFTVSAAGVLTGAFTMITIMNGLLSKFCPSDGLRTPVAFK